MSTKVYGCSDDLVLVKGDVDGEVDCYGTDDADHGVLLTFSDGTILEVKYGKVGMAKWGIQLIQVGSLFERIAPCNCDEGAKPHSDIAHFRDRLKWAFASTEWQRVR